LGTQPQLKAADRQPAKPTLTVLFCNWRCVLMLAVAGSDLQGGDCGGVPTAVTHAGPGESDSLQLLLLVVVVVLLLLLQVKIYGHPPVLCITCSNMHGDSCPLVLWHSSNTSHDSRSCFTASTLSAQMH
jgi:hypothetical protein